jgi:putative oxidoreductase
MAGKSLKQMADYGRWLGELHFPLPHLMAYLGKGSELVGGILLALGLFTRFSCVVLLLTFLAIVFFMGHGQIFTSDQHPFMYVLFCLLYLFNGAGKLSADHLFFKK